MDAENPIRLARIARGLSLETVIAETRLSPHVAQKIDAGRFAELPAGLYARAYVRAVARTVGLDPEQALAQVADQLPGAPDPLPVLREVAEQSRPGWPASVARCAASTLDGVFIGTLVSALAFFVTAVTGVPIGPSTSAGCAGLAVLAVIVAVPYFIILAGIAGLTPGQLVARAPVAEQTGPLTLAEIRSRASAAVLGEIDLLRELSGHRFCPNVTVGWDGWG